MISKIFMTRLEPCFMSARKAENGDVSRVKKEPKNFGKKTTSQEIETMHKTDTFTSSTDNIKSDNKKVEEKTDSEK